MPNPTLEFTEGPPGNPPDASQTVAVFGFARDAVPGTPQIYDSAADVPVNAGPGKASRAIYHVLGSKKRQVLVPCEATTTGTVSAVTQTGTGPAVSVAIDNSDVGAIDDADVEIEWMASGAPGVAKVAFSWAWTVINNTPERLKRPAITMPALMQATIVGNVDLTTIVYAQPATLVGTVDLRSTAGLFGAGGTLDGKTILLDIDNAGDVTVTLGTGASAPVDADDLVADLTAGFAAADFSIDNQGHLVIASQTLGATSEIDCDATSTGDAILGLSNTPVNGTAGALDGLTLILDENLGAPQTLTFGTGASAVADAAAAVAAVAGLTNIDADLYTSSNFLRVQSTTKGSASALSITGGTGRTALGLAIVNAVGANATYTIEHLGVTVTFPDGTYPIGRKDRFTTKAPVPDFDEVTLRLADLIGRKIPFGRILLAFEQDLVTSLADAGNLDTKIAENEAVGNYFSGILGVRPTEADADVRATFLAFRSRRVDKCARGIYLRAPVELVPGGGEILSSSSFAYAERCATLPFYRDPGEHKSGPLPGVTGVTTDEIDATVKLVEPVSAEGSSWNVIDSGSSGFNFAGGYSSASGVSRYCDKNTRDSVLRMAVVGRASADAFINTTEIDTDSLGQIADGSAREIEGAIERALREELVPEAAQAVEVLVLQNYNYYTTKELKWKGTMFNRSPARAVSGIIGPGVIQEA